MKNNKNHFYTNCLLLFSLVNTITFIFIINHFLTPNLTKVAKANLEKEIYIIASDYRPYSQTSIKKDAIFETQKNNLGEITSINYNMDSIYELASIFERYIRSSLQKSSKISSLEFSVPEKTKENIQGIILYIPAGLLTNSPLFTNLGPKIPVAINFIDTFFTQVKTKVIDYGMNNALIEIYLNVIIRYYIIGGNNSDEQELEYNLLLGSRIVQGKIPNWYAGSYEKRSAFYEMNTK